MEGRGSAYGWGEEQGARKFVRPVVVVIQKMEDGGEVVQRALNFEPSL